jgi:hypothetical protein
VNCYRQLPLLRLIPRSGKCWKAASMGGKCEFDHRIRHKYSNALLFCKEEVSGLLYGSDVEQLPAASVIGRASIPG